MRKIFLILIISSIFIIFPFHIFAAEYYVALNGSDINGDGSIGNPWYTITRGAKALKAGDTLFIREGIYKQSVELGAKDAEGTKESRIVIMAYPGEKVILQGTELLQNWEKCEPNDPNLNIEGVINKNYSNIYKTRVHSSLLPANLSNVVLFENNKIIRIAAWPDRTLGYGQNTDEMRFVPEEAFGNNDRLTDSEVFDNANPDGFWYQYIKDLSSDQIDRYWSSSRLFIWFRSDGNYTSRFSILRHENKAVVSDQNYRRGLAYGDKYSIENHPHALDTPGEYFCSYKADDQGYYTIYLWPENVNNLISNISIRVRNDGVRVLWRKYITIRGLHIVGYIGCGINFLSDYKEGQVNDGAVVENCIITDCGSSGISIVRADNVTVKSCIVERVGRFGIVVSGGGINHRIIGCSVRDSDATNIYLAGSEKGMIIDNRIFGSSGVHGNGTACYLGCKKVLIARNIYYNASNATLQNISDVIFFANIMDGKHENRNFLANWGDSNNSDYPTQGYQVFINNTIIRGDEPRHTVVSFSSQSRNYVYNNLIGGSFGWNLNMFGRTHNGWIPITNQHTIPVTSLEGEWYLPSEYPDIKTQYSKFFTDIDAADYTLVANCSAVGAGRDLNFILNDQTLSDTGTSIKQDFPDFNFGVDISGNPWAVKPSMGAYEYGSISIKPEVLPDPIDPINSYDPNTNDPNSLTNSNDINVVTELKVLNNVLKGAVAQATVRMMLSESGNASVKIYDSKGKEVIALFDGYKDAGTYDLIWAGVNSSGSKVGSGVYMVHMRAGSYKETKKIVVVK